MHVFTHGQRVRATRETTHIAFEDGREFMIWRVSPGTSGTVQEDHTTPGSVLVCFDHVAWWDGIRRDYPLCVCETVIVPHPTPLVPDWVPEEFAVKFQDIADFAITDHTREEHEAHLQVITPAEMKRIGFLSGHAAFGAVYTAVQIARGRKRSENPLPLLEAANRTRSLVMREALSILRKEIGGV